MTHPTLRDRDVARLPLGEARAELFAAIVATPATTTARVERRWRGPLVVAAAVAAVATVVAVPVVTGRTGTAPTAGRSVLDPGALAPAPAPTEPTEPTEPVVAPSVPGGGLFALSLEGWDLTTVYAGSGSTTITYTNGDRRLDLELSPADQHRSYVADRDTLAGRTEGVLLGRPAITWAYGADDHTTIRAAEGAQFLEVRGSAMSLATYRTLLAALVQTDEKGFAASVPDGVVTPYNRDRAIAHLLEGVDVPPGFTASDVRLDGFQDAYQAAVRVASSVGCAWLDRWDGANAAGQAEVLAAFEGSRRWPALRSTVRDGAYAEEFWKVAARLRAGEPVADIRAGICL